MTLYYSLVRTHLICIDSFGKSVQYLRIYLGVCPPGVGDGALHGTHRPPSVLHQAKNVQLHL
jgi:hypothetical protein